MNIPFNKVEFNQTEIDAVAAVMQSGRIAMGPVTEEFEQAFAAAVGTKYAVMMSSGTTALEAVLASYDAGPGDEVITTAFTFNATASSIARTGATPVFVDIGRDYLIDPAAIEAAITPRTLGIVPVHLYGALCDMKAITRIADRYNLLVIEDAAQAFDTTDKDGRKAGSFGNAGVFSLYATKNLTSGEGGMITTDDEQMARQLRMFRNQGMYAQYEHDLLGTNARPTDLTAAIGLSQLRNRAEERRARRTNGLFYGMASKAGLCFTQSPIGHSFHQYTLRIPEGRERFREAMKNEGVETAVYYPTPVHRQPWWSAKYAEWPPELPVTDEAARTVVQIPVRGNLKPEEAAYIGRRVDACL